MDNRTAVLVQGVLLPLAAGSVGKGECATSRRLWSVVTRPSLLEIPPVPKHSMHSDLENIPKYTQTHPHPYPQDQIIFQVSLYEQGKCHCENV